VQSVEVGYEKYGMQSDLDYFTEQMEADQDVFSIRELNWTRDGTTSKEDRVQRLVPDFLKGKFYLPLESPGETSNQKRMRESGQGYRVLVPAKRKDHEGNLYSLNKQFLDEFLFFPFAVHDDLIDACSRVYDMEYQAPVIIEQAMCEPEVE
jgi:phage terminase large subunit-like protein